MTRLRTYHDSGAELSSALKVFISYSETDEFGCATHVWDGQILQIGAQRQGRWHHLSHDVSRPFGLCKASARRHVSVYYPEARNRAGARVSPGQMYISVQDQEDVHPAFTAVDLLHPPTLRWCGNSEFVGNEGEWKFSAAQSK
eukprot:3666123-Pyramimonas_sp.AAC.4